MRKVSNRPQIPIIIGEGSTEYYYFNHLKKINNYKIKINRYSTKKSNKKIYLENNSEVL